MILGTHFRLALLACGGVTSVFAPDDFNESHRPQSSQPSTSLHGTQVQSPAMGLPVLDRTVGNEAVAGLPAHVPFSFRLFGQPIQVAVPAPPSDPSPSRPPGLHVTFPPLNKEPVLNRHLAGIMSANAYHAQLSPVPGATFQDVGVRSRLLAWSELAMSYPHLEFDYHFARHEAHGRAMTSYLYMYRPMSTPDFMYIFPKATVDWSRVTPVVAYRVRVPQRSFLAYGKVEIAGIEMAIDKPSGDSQSGKIAKGPLRTILDVIERPPQHVFL